MVIVFVKKQGASKITENYSDYSNLCVFQKQKVDALFRKSLFFILGWGRASVIWQNPHSCLI